VDPPAKPSSYVENDLSRSKSGVFAVSDDSQFQFDESLINGDSRFSYPAQSLLKAGASQQQQLAQSAPNFSEFNAKLGRMKEAQG
jgi:hypothetical protein